MYIVLNVGGIGACQGQISAFYGITATGLRMTLQTVGSFRKMNGLDGLVQGNGHIRRVGYEVAANFNTFVFFLMAYQTINVFKLGSGGTGS